jgi:hypothetical protein
VARSSYTLTPRLYRHPATTDLNELVKIEAAMLSRFKQRSLPYLTSRPPEDWEFLFLMQHFGVPTRLLDWTESPLIALYFATAWRGSSHGTSGPESAEDAAVWMLDPIAWNRDVLEYLSYTGGILSVGDPPLTGYRPTEDGPTNREAVALYGIHNSPRIVAQRGAFTIFGQNTAPMENVYVSASFLKDCLIKVILPRDSLPVLTRSVVAVGITDSVVWPDLDGLAKEIKRQFGYEV